MYSRRKFIKISTLSTPIISALTAPIDQNLPKSIIISTWDEGKNVNAAAWDILGKGGKAIDAIEKGGNYAEEKVSCCVGLGGNPDRDGIVTLDACIMDEHANCGAVAGLEQIKHPISVARKLMDTTPHVLLVGAGAQQFAVENGFKKELSILSKDAANEYKKWLEKNAYSPVINIENKKQNGPFSPSFFDDGTPNHDTMGMIAIDTANNLSGGVTTSGMAFKMHGRVGDSAIIGAGLFVDNEVGAATSSGVGEEVIRICGTHLVVEFMRMGHTPEKACKMAVERIVNRNRTKAKEIQVGFIAVNKKGQYGAYAIQKGFVFAVKNATVNTVFASKYLL
jgi:N4-(beta-N-acetylglucosaminyl)-L-asparaginase